jgi:predicted ABC-type transport system involved in lysophospholipase L1 biosynthesis ATPase subunit
VRCTSAIDANVDTCASPTPSRLSESSARMIGGGNVCWRVEIETSPPRSARAFSNSPRLLFADEPTGNLDSETGARIVELLETLNRESGTTIVLVTHDLALARRAQRIIRLADGAVISDSSTGVLTDPTDDSGAAAPALQD